MTDRFWERLALEDMSDAQWESLCDGCGKCCLQKLEDDATGEIYYTSVACQYLGRDCACSVYDQRLEKVPGCLDLTPADVPRLTWLPESCAYRRVYEGRGLPDWHPLITGNRASTRQSGQSVQVWSLASDARVPEAEWEDYIIFKVG